MTNVRTQIWPFHATPPQRVPFQALNAAAVGSYSASSSSRERTQSFALDLDLDRAAFSAEVRAVHEDLAATSFRSLPD